MVVLAMVQQWQKRLSPINLVASVANPFVSKNIVNASKMVSNVDPIADVLTAEIRMKINMVTLVRSPTFR